MDAAGSQEGMYVYFVVPESNEKEDGPGKSGGTQGDGMSENEFKAVTCGCGEAKRTPSVSLVTKILDCELTVNVVRVDRRRRQFERRPNLQNAPGTKGIMILVARELWTLACCVSADQKTGRFAGKRFIQERPDYSHQSDTRRNPDVNRTTMGGFCKFVWSQLPAWRYPDGDSWTHQCLSGSGWDGFGPAKIKKDTKIDPDNDEQDNAGNMG